MWGMRGLTGLLTGPEPRREGDWILLRVPPCRHADRALRATA